MKLEFVLHGFILTHLFKDFTGKEIHPWVPSKLNLDYSTNLIGFTVSDTYVRKHKKYYPYEVKKL
jgi:hypothetical protein